MIPLFCKTNDDKDPTHVFTCGCDVNLCERKAMEGIEFVIKMH